MITSSLYIHAISLLIQWIEISMLKNVYDITKT